MPLVIELLKKDTRDRLIKAGVISHKQTEQLLSRFEEKYHHLRMERALLDKIMREPPLGASIYRKVKGRKRLISR